MECNLVSCISVIWSSPSNLKLTKSAMKKYFYLCFTVEKMYLKRKLISSVIRGCHWCLLVECV